MKPETVVQRRAIDAVKAYGNIDVIRIEPGFGATFGLPDTLMYFGDSSRLYCEFKCRPRSAVSFGKSKLAIDKLRNSQKRTFPVLARHGETILVVEGLFGIADSISYELLSFNDPTIRETFANPETLAAYIVSHFGPNSNGG